MANEGKITETQQNMLGFIEDYILSHSRPPTFRDIQKGVKISSLSMVSHHLDALREAGQIEFSEGSSRGVWVKGLPKPGDFVRVAMCGTITCDGEHGVPQEESIDPKTAEDWIPVARSLVGDVKPDDLYALRASGDSMIDAMINHGDLVIMRKNFDFKDGGLYAIRFTDRNETTLKRVFKEGKRFKLKPENPELKPYYVDAKAAQLQGRVVCVVRAIAM
jgi:repressor LexA